MDHDDMRAIFQEGNFVTGTQTIRAEQMPPGSMRATGDAETYPSPNTIPESQIITLTINKKEAKIKPSSQHYGTFAITYGDEGYSLDLSLLPKITKEFVICLTNHAIRLKKNIRFLSSAHDIIVYNIETTTKEIVFIKYGTEHYSARITRTRHLEFPNKKVKCEELEVNVNRRIKVYALPEVKEMIGYEFKDLKNNPIAYMSTAYGAIQLLWNILAYNDSPTDLPKIYLDYILTNYSGKCDEVKAKAMERIEQERERKKKIEYTNFIDKMYRDSIHELEVRRSKAQADIDTHMRGLHLKGKEFTRDGDFLLKLQNRNASKEIKAQLEIDYRLISKLRKTNKYTNFRFDAGSIVGQTSMIKFFDKYEIGIFDVYLSLNGVVKCHNKTYHCEGDYDHPHVSYGNPCWGNLGEAVFKMLRSNQFGAAFDMMYEFLRRYNDGRARDGMNKPYRRLEHWNPAFLRQGLAVCNNCGRIKELCQCSQNGDVLERQCLNCGRPFGDCGCARCPAEQIPNNIIGVDVECNHECEHYSQDDGGCIY